MNNDSAVSALSCSIRTDTSLKNTETASSTGRLAEYQNNDKTKILVQIVTH